MLSANIARGEAMFWYLGHSGWAVKTSDHFLVFDYNDDTRARKADHPCLATGCIEPKELKNQHLTVFSSHAHPDHFCSSVFDWKKENPEAEFVLCFQPDGVSEPYTYLPVNTESEVNGMTVYTIRSTDSGGGFLLEVDGLVIFHMGDHANGDDALAEDFTREIDLVAAKNKKIDVMLGPIRGCSLGTPSQVKSGTYYAIEKLDPALFVPMHSGAYSFEYRKFTEQAAKDGLEQPMMSPVNKGDRFHYVHGEPIVSR
jgi:L-ascorbate metabolism protein UlaG (beta-lactamase superfamily)